MWFINNGINQKLQMTQVSTNETEFNRLRSIITNCEPYFMVRKKKIRKRHYRYFASEHNAFDRKLEKYIIAKVRY